VTCGRAYLIPIVPTSYMDYPRHIATVGYTTLRVSEEMADELHDLKKRGDSYDDVIRRLVTDE